MLALMNKWCMVGFQNTGWDLNVPDLTRQGNMFLAGNDNFWWQEIHCFKRGSCKWWWTSQKRWAYMCLAGINCYSIIQYFFWEWMQSLLAEGTNLVTHRQYILNRAYNLNLWVFYVYVFFWFQMRRDMIDMESDTRTLDTLTIAGDDVSSFTWL